MLDVTIDAPIGTTEMKIVQWMVPSVSLLEHRMNEEILEEATLGGNDCVD